MTIRSDVETASLVPTIREIVREQDPLLVVQNVQSMEGLIADSLRSERFSTWLLSLCGLAALALALIGVYGVVAYAVSQRTQELGVRLALGASRRDVFTLVFSRTLWPVAAGLAGGLVLSLLATRALTTQLYGVSPHDPVIFGGVAVLLAVAAVAASFVPARRATRIDPLEALRLE